MKSYKMFLIPFLFASLNALAKDSLILDMTILNDRSAAEAMDSRVHSYLQTQSSSQTVSALRGTGRLESLSKNSSEQTTTVIGKDVKGYSQLTLESAGKSKLKMRTNAQLTVTADSGQNLDLSFNLEQDGVITKGTWESYLAGEEIEFRATAESEKRARAELAHQTAKALQSALSSAYAKNLKFSTKVKVADEGVKDSYCRATLKEMNCYSNLIKLNIQIDVSGL